MPFVKQTLMNVVEPMTASRSVSTLKDHLSACVVQASCWMLMEEHAIVRILPTKCPTYFYAQVLSKLPVARITCGAHQCSHICAIIGGLEECFCPAGLELAAGSTTDCAGRIEWTPPNQTSFGVIHRVGN